MPFLSSMNAKIFAALLGLSFSSLSVPIPAATIGEDRAKSIVKEATEMFIAFRKNSEVRTGASEIPSRFWTASIRDLRPVKVYIHMNNIVVAQELADGKEAGVYIYQPYSSYLPMHGVHGFALTPKPNTAAIYKLGTGVFSYEKVATNQAVQ